MRSITISIIFGAFLASHITSAQPASATWTKQSKISYGIGLEIGRNIRAQGSSLDLEALYRGIQDGAYGLTPAVADSVLQVLLEEYGREMIERQAAKAMAASEQNREAGNAFVEKFKQEPGVVVLESGILYKVIKSGTGPRPTVDKTVVCHYRGTLVDGIEFDSSFRRNEPTTFPLRNVIKGWQEIIPMMAVGSKWQVVIPPHLAYGERGSGETIGPSATLIFEIELIAIK